MYTLCPNPDCAQRYKINPQHLGQKARCRRCNTVFEITPADDTFLLTDLPMDQDDEEGEQQADSIDEKGKRRSPKEIMEEQIANIRNEVDRIIPALIASWERQENESDTRLLVDRILQKALGFTFEDIKTEQRIEGRRADYVLLVKGEAKLVGEVKRVGMSLRAQQVFQASSYAAYSGIHWAFLTNGLIWQLYHISTGDRIETDLVFTIDLKDGVDYEEAWCFYLMSKSGLQRKKLLEKTWQKISSLCYDNLISAILSDEVISKIRIVINRESKASATDDEIRNALESNLFQLS